MEQQISPLAMEDAPEIGRMVAGLDFTLIQDQLTPIFNSPLTVYLASEACQSTHGVFSSVGGHYARSTSLTRCAW